MSDISALFDQVLAWLEPLYLTYGYLVVFLSAMLEHTFFLAWAVPGGILVAIGGLYASQGILSLPVVILAGTLGFTLGDHLDFFVGRRSSYMLHRVTRGRSRSAARLLGLRALPVMILGYTNTIPRSAMFIGGSASGLTYRRFLSLSLPLALFWSTVDGLVGYWVGSNRDQLESTLRSIGIGGQLALLAVLVVAFVMWRRRRRPGGTAVA